MNYYRIGIVCTLISGVLFFAFGWQIFHNPDKISNILPVELVILAIGFSAILFWISITYVVIKTELT